MIVRLHFISSSFFSFFLRPLLPKIAKAQKEVFSIKMDLCCFFLQVFKILLVCKYLFPRSLALFNETIKKKNSLEKLFEIGKISVVISI